MKILKKNIDSQTGSGTFTLEMTCIEDAYVLSNIIFQEDVVEATSTRKLSLDGGRTQQKITLTLAVKVESTNFDLSVGIIDLKGKIVKENEYVRLGSYHTHHIAVGDKFKLFKENWTRRDIFLAHDATKEKQVVCLAIFYDKEYVISLVSSIGLRSIYKDEIKKNKNFKQAIAAVSKVREAAKAVVIAGFSDQRSEFHKALTKECPGIDKKTTVIKLSGAYKGIPNSRVVEKMLLDKELSRVFSDFAYVEGLREIERFFGGFSTDNGLICFGDNEVKEALEYGAVKTLFITESKHRPASIEERRKIERLLSSLRELRAKIYVIPDNHELGVRLKDLGSLACELMFEYK